MRLILLLLLLPLTVLAASNNAEDFLKAWENNQANHPAVTSFEKISDGKYQIEFSKLPYKGELLLLSYDVDSVGYLPENSHFNKIGYATIDLPNQLDTLIQKYNRLYYKWAQGNTLYFNEHSQTWENQAAYLASFKTDINAPKPSIWARIFKYWDVLFIAMMLYFLWSTFIGNRRAKASVEHQKQSTEALFAQNHEATERQKQAIDDTLELQKETNQLLKDILDALNKA